MTPSHHPFFQRGLECRPDSCSSSLAASIQSRTCTPQSHRRNVPPPHTHRPTCCTPAAGSDLFPELPLSLLQIPSLLFPRSLSPPVSTRLSDPPPSPDPPLLSSKRSAPRRPLQSALSSRSSSCSLRLASSLLRRIPDSSSPPVRTNSNPLARSVRWKLSPAPPCMVLSDTATSRTTCKLRASIP